MMLASCPTLDGFATEASRRNGVSVETLAAGAALLVRTRHSTYRIVVLDGSHHLVRVEGGVFPEPTVVRLTGATFGGSTLKAGWIVVGLRIEFGLGPRQITSSSVQSFVIEDTAPLERCDELVA
jgi:hypothetical protein